MRTGRTALQLGRILVLVFLLRATGRYVSAFQHGITRMQAGALWGPWALVSLVSVLFVLVVLVGRRWWHPWAVLAAEAIVAAVLAFVPPWYWILWFGIGGWSGAMAGGFVQPLAVGWLGVVALRCFHQARDAKTAAPQRANGGADTSDESGEGGRVVSS